ncbi:hypothetical protein TSUD_362820 [Trifolium subterraneum]|uniref:Uncharacterized protein n=1 Tax=Trifolium subterraneum TaxID=3900 RepID=A0A2Z6NVI0_TRISU|nr:hypothetical protein TSUD_362820 [Trifolium subterraneum]
MATPEEAVVKCDCKVDDGGSSRDSRGDSGIDVVMEDDKNEEEGCDAVERIFRRQFISLTCNYF